MLHQNVDLNMPITYDEAELERAKQQKGSKKKKLREVEERLQKYQKAIQDFSNKAQRL
jgi:glycerate kinase